MAMSAAGKVTLGVLLAMVVYCWGHGPSADGEAAAPRWDPPTLSTALLSGLPQDASAQFTWPGEGQQAAPAVADDRVRAANTSAVEWLRQAVAPAALPGDLEDRLIPVQEAVFIPGFAKEYPPGRFDTIFAQWEANGYVIHSAQSSYGLSLAITPGVSDRVEQPPRNDIEFVARVARWCLADPYVMLAATLSDVRTVEGVTQAMANKRIVPRLTWASSVWWYTDGQSVVFAGAKATSGPMDPPIVPDWF